MYIDGLSNFRQEFQEESSVGGVMNNMNGELAIGK